MQQSFNKKSIKKQVQPQVITRTTHNYKDFIQTLHERNTPVTNSELYENVHGKRKNNHCKRTHGNKSGELLTNVHIRFTRDIGNLETQIKHCTPSTITNHCSLEISNNKLEDSRRNFNSTIIPTDRVTEGEIQHKPNTYPIYTIKPNTTRLDKLTPINKINQELILHKYIQSSKSTELDQFLNAPKQRKSSQIIQNQLQSLQVEQRPKQFNNYRTFVQHIKEDKSQYSTINISSEIKTKQHPALFNNRLINTSNIVYQTTNIQNNNHITYPKYNRKSHIFTLHNSNNTSKHKSHLTNKGLQSLHKASPHTQNQATINNSSRIRQLEHLHKTVQSPIRSFDIKNRENSIESNNQETHIHSRLTVDQTPDREFTITSKTPKNPLQPVAGNQAQPANTHPKPIQNASATNNGSSRQHIPFLNKTSSSTTSTNTKEELASNHQAQRIGTYSATKIHPTPTRELPNDQSRNKNSTLYTANYYAPISDHQPSHPNMNNEDNENNTPLPSIMTTPRTTFQDVIRLNTYTPPPLPLQNGDWTLVAPTRELQDQEPVNRKQQDFPSVFPTTVADKHTLDVEDVPMIQSGMNIRIKLTHNMQVDPKKLIKAMLACMQTVDAWAGLRPIETGKVKDNKVLRTNSDVDEIITYHYYLDNPLRKNLSKEYTVRLKTETSLPLLSIINQPLVREWLNIERVTSEINNLDTAYLSNVGFLQHALPTAEHLSIYKERVSQAMGHNKPEFEMALKTIYPERAKDSRSKSEKYLKTQVIMIRASENDVFTLTKIFQAIRGQQEFTFFPWMEYVTLTAAQKRTIVITQDQFIQNHKSLLIPMFTPEVNITPLVSDDDFDIEIDDIQTQQTTVSDMDLTTTTTLTFIANHYKAGDGSPLFSFVYSAVGDTIETLVRRAYYAEAKECAQHIHTDLLFYSNQNTKDTIFHPLILTKNMNGYIPWQPLQWKHYIQPTDGIPHEVPLKYNNKRTRTTITTTAKAKPTNIVIPTHAKGTYAIAAANRYTAPSDITTTTKTSNNSTLMDDLTLEVANMQKQCKELKLSHQDYNLSIQAMEHRIDTSIDKKLEHHTQATESKINTLFAEAEDNTNKFHKQFYKDVAVLISQTVNASVNAAIAASMEKLESRLNLSPPLDTDMMDTTGTDMLPLKRNDTQNENIPPDKPKLNINPPGNKTSDWKQRKLI